MCGIFCAFCNKNSDISNIELKEQYNQCEDFLKRRGPDHQNCIEAETDCHKLIFGASVLWLQGQSLTKQPIENENSIFIYNGDIFGGEKIEDESRNMEGDTGVFLNTLENNEDKILGLSKILGPYAFIYLDKQQNRLYFSRDIYGRRSLLIGKRSDIIIVTSVAKKSSVCNFLEVPAIGVFYYDLLDDTLGLMPWKNTKENNLTKVKELTQFLQIKMCLNTDFSIATQYVYKEPNVIQDLNIFDEISSLNFDEAMDKLLKNDRWRSNVLKLKELLEKSVETRIATQPQFCQNCYESKSCTHTLSGVLFSGGIDCSILALIASKFTSQNRPIDLINVAFDKVKDYKTPDRITGLETFEELQQLEPYRKWNFVQVNVTENELNEERFTHIRHLIYPLNSILDDSLGCALWFAARGKSEEYKSPCRVLIVGMGADELFGGYTNHRNALKRKGWKGLHDSLEESIENISIRNLGRDDRVAADHGRQLRTPYLDEHFLEFVRSLQCWERTCPREDLQQGFGDKILLRSLGYYLGLKKASNFKKRALQFGSKIANPKESAQDISPRL